MNIIESIRTATKVIEKSNDINEILFLFHHYRVERSIIELNNLEGWECYFKLCALLSKAAIYRIKQLEAKNDN